jgi:hypothetical protein
MKKVLWTLLLSCSLFSTAFAWDSTGHKVIAQIAYDNLTPEAKGQIEILIPVVGQYYNLNNFVDAAPWADWLKGDSVYAFNNWHYIDQPISQGACDKCAQPLPAPAPENVVWAIQQAQQVLATPNSTKYPQESNFEKSMFLLFLEHFVGDAHQPLHAVDMFSDTFPTGDQGGNLYKINSSVSTNLHGYWDQGGGVFPESMTDAQVQSLAASIEKAFPEGNFGNQVTDLNPSNWAQESMQIAQNIVYTIPENTAPTVQYTATAQTTAEQQAALAGYRLANILNQIFE